MASLKNFMYVVFQWAWEIASYNPELLLESGELSTS